MDPADPIAALIANRIDTLISLATNAREYVNAGDLESAIGALYQVTDRSLALHTTIRTIGG